MTDKGKIVGFIKTIANSVKQKKYNEFKDLEKDFYSISRLIWEDIDNVMESDLENLSYVHSFLIDEVCKIHLEEKNNQNEILFKKSLDINEIKVQLKDGKRACDIYAFRDEYYDYYFIGDLHSDCLSLKKILDTTVFFKSITNNEKKRLVFLGDYIDRGKSHLETIELILLLKYIFPNNIYLLRGNHDGGKLVDGKVKLCVGKNKGTIDSDYFPLYVYELSNSNKTFSKKIVKGYLEFFDSMCNIGILSLNNLNILIVHGGIPRPSIDSDIYYAYINTISDLTNLEILDHLDRTIIRNMLWSDPCEEVDKVDLNQKRFKFHKEHFLEFIDRLGLDLIIRGHEAEEEGFKAYFDNQLFTIFSNGRILDENNKDINYVTAYKHVNPKILKINKKQEKIIIDINKIR